MVSFSISCSDQKKAGLASAELPHCGMLKEKTEDREWTYEAHCH